MKSKQYKLFCIIGVSIPGTSSVFCCIKKKPYSVSVIKISLIDRFFNCLCSKAGCVTLAEKGKFFSSKIHCDK